MKRQILLTLGFFTMFCSVVLAGGPIRVLIITGGHDFEREPFFEMFKGEKDITYREVQHPNATKMFRADERSSYDVIVLYDMWETIPDEDGEAALDLLNAGKGVVALHHCIASYSDYPDYERVIGGKFFIKETKEGDKTIPASTYQHDQKLNVHICDLDHPITKGMKDFIIQDEVYGGFRVLEGVHRLLETDHPLSGKTIGWCHTYGPSRIVYIQLGHDHLAYNNPNYRQLVRQAIRWAAGRLGGE
jgi:hypothetical protein